MALAMVVTPDSPVIGDTVNVTVTGATATGVVELTISSPDESEDIKVEAVAAGGAVDFSTVLDFAPEHEGEWTLKVHDVTADTDIQEVVEVFASA